MHLVLVGPPNLVSDTSSSETHWQGSPSRYHLSKYRNCFSFILSRRAPRVKVPSLKARPELTYHRRCHDWKYTHYVSLFQYLTWNLSSDLSLQFNAYHGSAQYQNHYSLLAITMIYLAFNLMTNAKCSNFTDNGKLPYPLFVLRFYNLEIEIKFVVNITQVIWSTTLYTIYWVVIRLDSTDCFTGFQ